MEIHFVSYANFRSKTSTDQQPNNCFANTNIPLECHTNYAKVQLPDTPRFNPVLLSHLIA